MNKWLQLSVKRHESGMSFLEVMIVLGFLGVVMVGIGARIQLEAERLERLRSGQTVEAIEASLLSSLSHEEHVLYSAAKGEDAQLQSCAKGRGSCRDGATFPIDFHLVGEERALSGEGVRYSDDGTPCYTENCGPIKVLTVLRTFCSGGGFSLSSCMRPRFMAVAFQIIDVQRKRLLRKDSVEVKSDARFLTKRGQISCPAEHILRGIGFSGQPLCTALDNVVFEDAALIRPGVFVVQPADCRSEAPGQEEDAHFVKGITQEGELVCAPKYW